MNITTKYSIGDKVWLGVTHWLDKSVKCPECEYGYIKITLKSGESDLCKCPKCYGRGYKHAYDFHPIVNQLTIGSVRFDSAGEDDMYEYVCVETGIGTGGLYKESLLHPTQAEAEIAAALETERAREHSKKEQAEREARDKAEYERPITIPADSE